MSVSLEKVKKFSTLKGYVTGLDKSSDSLSVDVGVFDPNTVPAVVSLSRLAETPSQRRKNSLKKLPSCGASAKNCP